MGALRRESGESAFTSGEAIKQAQPLPAFFDADEMSDWRNLFTPLATMMCDLLNELANPVRELNPEVRAQLVAAMRVSPHGTAPSNVGLAWDEELATRIAAYERGDAVLFASQNVFAKARPITG